MSKIALITLGQIVGTDIEKSISAFASLSVRDSWFPSVISYPAYWVMAAAKYTYDFYVTGNIDKYKKGEMTTADFISYLREEFSVNASDDDIKSAWNAMCGMSERARNKFANIIEDLRVHHDYKLAIVTMSNPLQYECVMQQFKNMSGAFAPLVEEGRIKIISSFEEKTLDFKYLVKTVLQPFDRQENTIYSLLHAMSSKAAIGLEKANFVLCDFDHNKELFEHLVDSKTDAHHAKEL